MLNNLHAYKNVRSVDWNTCGQAAIATIVDFHGLDPWHLPRSIQGQYWYSGDAIDAITRDGFGPDIIFGWGTSGARIEAALQHYGLVARTRGLFPFGGWEAAWPALRLALDLESPTPVLLDLGRLAGQNYVFHWAVAYAYNDERVFLANCPWNPNPNYDQFRRAWNCDFIFIPLDMKVCSVLTLPSAPVAQGDRVNMGFVMPADVSISSQDGRFILIYQSDANLVLYRTSDYKPLWDIERSGGQPGACVMQRDGNFVVYDAMLRPVWATNTWGTPAQYLVVQNDGNLVLYSLTGTPLWSSGTAEAAPPSDECRQLSAQISDVKRQIENTRAAKQNLDPKNPGDAKEIGRLNDEITTLDWTLAAFRGQARAIGCTD
jgi:hypothetical protein